MLLLAMTGWDAMPWRTRFKTLMPGRRVVGLGEDFDPLDVDYIATWKHPPGSLTPFRNARALFSLGAGVDHLFADAALPDLPIARIVDPDLTGRMSEYVALHCLMALRQQRRYDRQQRERIWDEDRDQPAARDVTVGIMGLGELGRDACATLGAIGFQLAGWSRSGRSTAGVETFAGPDGLAPFLATTDILVALVPLTPDTRGILNRATFAGLKRDGALTRALGGPVVINPGRGGLQVEADILSALDDGTLGHAVLDVFDREPLDPASPLWVHPRVTITPHAAATSTPAAIGRQIAEQIAALERGETLRNVVDRARGY